jgi:hypothetical protein
MIERFAIALNHYTFLSGLVEMVREIKPVWYVRLEFMQRFSVRAYFKPEHRAKVLELLINSPYVVTKDYGMASEPASQFHVEWNEVLP